MALARPRRDLWYHEMPLAARPGATRRTGFREQDVDQRPALARVDDAVGVGGLKLVERAIAEEELIDAELWKQRHGAPGIAARRTELLAHDVERRVPGLGGDPPSVQAQAHASPVGAQGE